MPSLASMMPRVFPVGQEFKMLDVDAANLLAAMVNVLAGWSRAVMSLPDNAMNLRWFPGPVGG